MEKFTEILKLVLNYFWEIFKFWEIIPGDLADKIEDEADKAAQN